MGMLQGCASAKQRDAAWWAYRAVAVFVRLHCAVIAGEAECKRDIKEGREEGERKGEGRRQLTVGSDGREWRLIHIYPIVLMSSLPRRSSLAKS